MLRRLLVYRNHYLNPDVFVNFIFTNRCIMHKLYGTCAYIWYLAAQ